MRDLHHILLPTDFSDNARTALPAAVVLARHHHATLHLLHVLTPLPWPAHHVLEKSTFTMLNDEIRRQCWKRLRTLADEVGDGVHTETHVGTGTPAAEIERFVGEHNVDLLALSTRGHTGLERFRLGSTTEKVVRTTPCPVLVVRDTATSWKALGTIMVATDFSELSELAIIEAAELARAQGASLQLVHALEDTDYPVSQMLHVHGMVDVTELATDKAKTLLERLRIDRIGSAIPATTAVLEGKPALAIADAATEQGTDLIVLATHGRTGLARLGLGSTAERVVRTAPCSVLVVKERGSRR